MTTPARKQGMRFEVERVTPAVAAAWLAKPWTRQRTLSQAVVAKYARAMAEGRWEEPSLDPIGFTPGGDLANGQHRLAAVIKADWRGDMLIAYDVPEENFLVLDTGRHRIASQFVRAPHAKTISAIARLALWYNLRHPVPPRGSAISFDNDELIAFIDDHLDALQKAALDADNIAKATGIPASVNGAVMYLAAEGGVDPDALDRWITGVQTGAELSIGDARLALRDKFVRYPGARQDQVTSWSYVVRAFNAHVHGRHVTRLQGESEDGRLPHIQFTPFQTTRLGPKARNGGHSEHWKPVPPPTQLPVMPRGNPTEAWARRQQAQALRADGKTNSEIAVILNVDPRTILRWLNGR